MIPRRHVPFACADENSRLLPYGHRKIPPWVLDRIRSWDKSYRRWIALGADALIDFGGLWSRGDASIGFADNFYKTR